MGDPNDARPIIDVPGPDASLLDLWDFALTLDGYGRYKFDELGQVANRTSDVWNTTGELPESSEDLRMALFFEQRRWRHFDQLPDGRSAEYIRALVEMIRVRSGGVVEDQRPINL